MKTQRTRTGGVCIVMDRGGKEKPLRLRFQTGTRSAAGRPELENRSVIFPDADAAAPYLVAVKRAFPAARIKDSHHTPNVERQVCMASVLAIPVVMAAPKSCGAGPEQGGDWFGIDGAKLGS